MSSNRRSAIARSFASFFACGVLVSVTTLASQAIGDDTLTKPGLITWTTQEDHQDMMHKLGISKLRSGPSGNPDAPNAANYDEAKANPYPDWPEVLKLNGGERVETAQQWIDQRRPEIIESFEREVYGRIPDHVPNVQWSVVQSRDAMSADIAVTEQHIVGTVDNSKCPEIEVKLSMSLTLPKETSGPVPVLMMFGPTPFDPVPEWMQRFRKNRPQGDGVARELSKTEALIAAGWGAVTINPATIQADKGDGLTRGIIGLTNLGQPRMPDDWGSLRAWGWGASRGLDYLSTDQRVRADRVGIEGVSRYGKAALVAAAFDTRFAMVLVGSSGAGGATPHRRNYGEAVENLAGSGEYHWMAGNFLKYAAEEATFGSMNVSHLPVDSHQLIALCAPRLTFISYGIPEKGDAHWLDQRGSYMATLAAGPVFMLLGEQGPIASDGQTPTDMPPVNTSLVSGNLAWRQHDGGHTDTPNIHSFIQWAESLWD